MLNYFIITSCSIIAQPWSSYHFNISSGHSHWLATTGSFLDLKVENGPNVINLGNQRLIKLISNDKSMLEAGNRFLFRTGKNYIPIDTFVIPSSHDCSDNSVLFNGNVIRFSKKFETTEKNFCYFFTRSQIRTKLSVVSEGSYIQVMDTKSNEMISGVSNIKEFEIKENQPFYIMVSYAKAGRITSFNKTTGQIKPPSCSVSNNMIINGKNTKVSEMSVKEGEYKCNSIESTEPISENSNKKDDFEDLVKSILKWVGTVVGCIAGAAAVIGLFCCLCNSCN